MEYLRACYTSEWRLFRDDLTRTVRGRYYWADEEAPVLPFSHYLWSERFQPEPDYGSVLGEAEGVVRRWSNGALPFPPPPAVVVGDSACDGMSGLTTDPNLSPLVAGIDQRCWINAGEPLPPWAVPVITPDYIPVATAVSGVYTDSPLRFVPGGCIESSVCIAVGGYVDATELRIGGTTLTALFMSPSDTDNAITLAINALLAGTNPFPQYPLTAGTSQYAVPRMSAAAGDLANSRIVDDPGNTAVEVSAELEVRSKLYLDVAGSPNPPAIVQPLRSGGYGGVSALIYDPVGGGSRGDFVIDSDGTYVTAALTGYGGITDVAYECAGQRGIDLSELGAVYTGGLRTGGALAIAYTNVSGLGDIVTHNAADFVAAGSLLPGMLLASPSVVATSESTASNVAVDLATAMSCSFSLPATYTVYVRVRASCTNTGTSANYLCVKVDGNAAVDVGLTNHSGGGQYESIGGAYKISLGSGAHTIKLQFRCSAGTATFQDRSLDVVLSPA